jgi:hypothetical protein
LDLPALRDCARFLDAECSAIAGELIPVDGSLLHICRGSIIITVFYGTEKNKDAIEIVQEAGCVVGNMLQLLFTLLAESHNGAKGVETAVQLRAGKGGAVIRRLQGQTWPNLLRKYPADMLRLITAVITRLQRVLSLHTFTFILNALIF